MRKASVSDSGLVPVLIADDFPKKTLLKACAVLSENKRESDA